MEALMYERELLYSEIVCVVFWENSFLFELSNEFNPSSFPCKKNGITDFFGQLSTRLTILNGKLVGGNLAKTLGEKWLQIARKSFGVRSFYQYRCIKFALKEKTKWILMKNSIVLCRSIEELRIEIMMV